MYTGWWYRATSAIGTAILAMAVAAASLYAASATNFGQPADASDILLATTATGLVVGLAMVPMYHPRPRRVSAMLETTVTRVGVACIALVVGGTVSNSPALTPIPVSITGITLALLLPTYYRTLRRTDGPERVLVLGDESRVIEQVTGDLPVEPVGLLSPDARSVPTVESSAEETDRWSTLRGAATTDGGETPRLPHGVLGGPPDGGGAPDGIDRLGGLVRLESVLVKYDIDTVALAFANAGQGDFFGSIAVAHDYGVDVLAHESHADSVLVDDVREGSLIAVEADPWPWYGHVTKRAFDVIFAVVGLVALTPLIGGIAVAIKLDSRGPIFYEQERTSAFGGRFVVRKFRTMVPESENPEPQDDGTNTRITRVGRLLRKTHADEIPQLWTVLLGEMSAVGPRAVWREEERLLETTVDHWRTRWHVKPGLTGLAQVNDVTSTAGQRKLNLDLEYIRNRSLWLDVRIVTGQLWRVLVDVCELTRLRIRSRR